MSWRIVALVSPLLIVLSTAPVCADGPEAARIDFSRDVRPILARNCFACHGPDEEQRQAGLRLDRRESAIARLESGSLAIVPAKPDESELYRRITAEDEFERMPPPDSGHQLTPDQIETLRRWIAAGASYAEHWAFVKPARPPLPDVKDSEWPRNGIDRLILARLERAGLAPAPEADRHVLVRRVSLDLRGLPPTLDEVEAFVEDDRPDAYERMVDRFLADPAFGERWARVWLDLARYADSRGYGSDPLRPHVWRYRDWVINAFNSNMPYDRFTIEQLAGDLLDSGTLATDTNPTRERGPESAAGESQPDLERLIATAFHRNTMTNTEGGTDDEEFRVAAIKDRVNTTLQVWMGLTAGCAQCHNHKFDPLSQREYYSLYAIFNQTADTDRADESPTVPAPTPRMLAEAERIDRRIADLRQRLETSTPKLASEQQQWEAAIRNAAGQKVAGRFIRIELPGQQKILSLAEVQVFSGETNIAPAGKATQSSNAFGGRAALAIDGNTAGRYDAGSTTHTRNESDPWWEVDLGGTQPIDRIVVWNRTDFNLHERLAGFRLSVLDSIRDAPRQVVTRQDIAEAPNPSREIALDGPRSAVPAELLPIIGLADDQRTATEREQLAAHFRSIAPSLQPIRDEIARLEKSKPEFPVLPVMQELPSNQRRKTHVMLKGNFLTKGEVVEPGVPEAFHDVASKAADAPLDRLALAHWLVDPQNPLTARVAVNRFWARIFGVGLVETEEDFGTQGELPSHPELLDWLAVEFIGGVESGESRDKSQMTSGSRLSTLDSRPWDIKRLLKLIVTSATYRQSSRVTPELLAADPHNRLLARAPRFRLEAETVRDQALALGGLLSRRLGGPSVYPPQPEGLWRAAFNGERKWPTSTGADRYRRGLYTFWRRTIPYPSMSVFDAPSREICTVRRAHTNTPLQAFVTLNDPVYVEAAQALARRILREGGATPEERARWALALCLSRPAESDQIATLVNLYQKELDHYQQNAEAARSLATNPLGPLPEGVDPAEAAAWTVVANVLLNLDGTLTRG